MNEPGHTPVNSAAASTPVSASPARRGLLLPFAKLLAIAVPLVFYTCFAEETYREKGYWDFILQWTLCRLAVTEDGDKIYDFAAQKALLQTVRDPEDLHFLDRPHMNKVGVSPYPPMMVVLFYPLGFLSLKAGQMCMVYLHVVLAVVSAWAISRSVAGRVSFGTALLAILYSPAFFISLDLGQNAIVLLAFWSLGWLALTKQRDLLAGLLWGLLCYKIQWLVAVGWLPLVLGRPKAYLGMAVSVLGLVGIATLAFGTEIWEQWYRVARTLAAAYYEPGFQQQLLGKACDVRAAVIRLVPTELESALGWMALGAIGGISFVVYLLARRKSRPANPDAVLAPTAVPLLFAAALVSPYLFHYDVISFLLPILVLWSHRAVKTANERRILAVLSVAFYLALPFMDQWTVDNVFGLRDGLMEAIDFHGFERWWAPWQGPPLAAAAHLALWLFALWFSCRWANRASTHASAAAK